ncbi:casein kinase II beta subunit CKB1 [Pyronema omphalodes]|nr:casein kinase II beta subunit CKB1 [Pyronema omphalodes]
MEEEESWIASFCNVVGHEYFAEVAEDFIEDDFNLTGLGAVVPMYKEALEMILDVEPEDDSESPGSASESLSDNPNGSSSYRRQRGHARTSSDYSLIETSAELLYGLIHQRFITSRQGIQVMYEKYLSNHFGFCPRVNCQSARVLPCGYSDAPGTETVKLFCPSCCDIYVPPNSRFQSVDGAYFGTTFPTLFLMTFPELDISGTGRKEVTASSTLNNQGGRKGAQNITQPPVNGVPANNIAPGLGKGKKYEMRIYGFKVNERARSGPRMGWLRDKPEDLAETDEWTTFHATYDSEDGGQESDEGDDDEEMGGRSSVVDEVR